MNVEYGNFKINFATLPEASQLALIRRGLAHFLGNEQASKVASHFEGVEPAPSAEAKNAYKLECQTAAVASLEAGTVGSVVRGPRGSTVETIARQIAVAEIKTVLKANGYVAPSGTKKVKFADGQEFTMGELVSRRMAKEGDRINKEAQAQMKRDEREVSKAGGVENLL